MRTGDPNATSSGRRPVSWSLEPVDDKDGEGDCVEDADDVPLSSTAATLRFETYVQARAWSLVNPGRVFTRGSDGHGFQAKPAKHEQGANPVQRGIDSYLNRSSEIKAMVPHLYYALESPYRPPFYRRTWHAELSRLSTSQLKRLRLLLANNLEDSRKHLRLLYAEMRRVRSMRADDYGVEDSEKGNEMMEGALADIDMRLTEGRHT